MPTFREALRMGRRLFTLRCPHCGIGPVIKWNGGVRRRCSSCNFRYERSDESYFSGAMFFGLLFGNFIYGAAFLILCVSLSPNIPWDTITWALPLGMIVVLIFWIPFSRVVYLCFDVMVRPVQPDELET